MTNALSQILSKTLTSVFGFCFLPSGIKNGLTAQKVNTPDDFKPVLRFAVCSDIHLNGEENQEAATRLRNLFEDMYKFSENKSYKNFDAIVVAGDFTGGGAEKEYEIFNKIIAENKREETKLLIVLGNHEFIDYRDVDATVGYKVYKKYISENVDTDVVLNGYHFIGVSYDDNGKTFTGKINWLEEKLYNATQENPEKPIFVYQHPAPTLTVYGSGNWGDMTMRKVLNKYPQVVDFSGHSHYAPSDPRSVWQGAFTAVGCGSLSAFMGNLNYIEGDRDAPGESGGAWLCEVDAEGNVSMKLYDIANRMFFENIDYYFTNLSKSSKRAYTWSQQKSLDTKPKFPENAKITTTVNENGETVLTFPEAKGFYPAENYKITVTNGNKKVFEKTVISEYVRATNEDVKVNLGTLEKGNYAVKITAYSPYAKKGQVLTEKIIIK